MKTLEQRIKAHLTTAKGEIRKDAEFALRLLQYGGTEYPCYYSGSGRFSRKAGGTLNAERHLIILGVNYEKG